MNTPTADQDELSQRKAKHIEICTDPQYQLETGKTYFDQVSFRHRSLPEINADAIDTSTTFLGRKINLPLFISCMTGGSEAGFSLNKALVQAAQECKVGVGTGSIRILFNKPQVKEHFHLRQLAPDVPIFTNLGAQELKREFEFDRFSRLNSLNQELQADAICIHLNPGQELFQDHGERDFSGLKTMIKRFIDASRIPVIVKETGCGVAPQEARKLLSYGAAYIDVAGAGGTSWIAVESYRLEELGRESARPLYSWGWPTAVLLAKLVKSKNKILASGGLRDGLDLAKALALGAHAGGFARPFAIAAQTGGKEGVVKQIQVYARTLRTVMLLTGSKNLKQLRNQPLDFTSSFIDSVKRKR